MANACDESIRRRWDASHPQAWGLFKHNVAELNSDIFGAKLPGSSPAVGTLKFSHVRYRAIAASRRSVSDCRGWEMAAAGIPVAVISVLFGGRGMLGGDAMLEIDPVARRHAEEIGRTPNHVILELVDLAVGIDQFPHHLDDTKAALFVQ